MSGQAQDTTPRGAYLVGGLMAADAESAMRTAMRILGDHLRAIPDGETGDRAQWIWWQIGKLTALDGIEMAGTHGVDESDNRDYSVFPALDIDPGVTELPARSLGYADAAEASYATFRRLRDEGIVPDGVRFQVSLPTPYATVVAWLRSADQERFFPVYAAALAREVRDIQASVPADDLLLQLDVAVELGALTGAFDVAERLGSRAFVLDALRDAVAMASGHGEVALHLCYGDYKHRHFTTPEDLSLCVELANAVADDLDVVHMPADRETGRRAKYFEPLRDLIPTRLALGVVDYEGDPARTQELIAAAIAGSGGMEFAVATECGMARIDERGPDAPSLEELLELHAVSAAPIRSS